MRPAHLQAGSLATSHCRSRDGPAEALGPPSPLAMLHGGSRRDRFGTDSIEPVAQGDPWTELELPAVPQAAAIVVLETCGPDAVHEIRDLERDEVLLEPGGRADRELSLFARTPRAARRGHAGDACA